jgi:hypothetical protein
VSKTIGSLGRVEHPVDRNRQLDHAEVRSEVSPGLRNLGDQESPDLTSQLNQLLPGEGV